MISWPREGPPRSVAGETLWELPSALGEDFFIQTGVLVSYNELDDALRAVRGSGFLCTEAIFERLTARDARALSFGSDANDDIHGTNRLLVEYAERVVYVLPMRQRALEPFDCDVLLDVRACLGADGKPIVVVADTFLHADPPAIPNVTVLSAMSLRQARRDFCAAEIAALQARRASRAEVTDRLRGFGLHAPVVTPHLATTGWSDAEIVVALGACGFAPPKIVTALFTHLFTHTTMRADDPIASSDFTDPSSLERLPPDALARVVRAFTAAGRWDDELIAQTYGGAIRSAYASDELQGQRYGGAYRRIRILAAGLVESGLEVASVRTVLLSAGARDEQVCRALREAGVPFEAAARWYAPPETPLAEVAETMGAFLGHGYAPADVAARLQARGAPVRVIIETLVLRTPYDDSFLPFAEAVRVARTFVETADALFEAVHGSGAPARVDPIFRALMHLEEPLDELAGAFLRCVPTLTHLPADQHLGILVTLLQNAHVPLEATIALLRRLDVSAVDIADAVTAQASMTSVEMLGAILGHLYGCGDPDPETARLLLQKAPAATVIGAYAQAGVPLRSLVTELRREQHLTLVAIVHHFLEAQNVSIEEGLRALRADGVALFAAEAAYRKAGVSAKRLAGPWLRVMNDGRRPSAAEPGKSPPTLRRR